MHLSFDSQFEVHGKLAFMGKTYLNQYGHERIGAPRRHYGTCIRNQCALGGCN